MRSYIEKKQRINRLSIALAIFIISVNCAEMAKKFDITENPFGVCSDPNAKNAPDGAMSECSNTVKRRDGIVQPRNGAVPLTISGLAFDEVTRIIPIDDDVLFLGDDGSKDTAVWLSDPDAVIESEEYTGNSDIVVDLDRFRAVNARGNIYIPTDTGVKKFESVGDVTVKPAGQECYAALLEPTFTSGSWLADGYAVAYRFTISHKDANGLETESIPSARFVIRNDEGAAYAVTLRIIYARAYDELTGEDKLNIYRTKQIDNTYDPGDVMYRVGSIIPYLGVSDEYQEYEDLTDDDSLGAYAYFDSSEESLETANFQPPLCKEIAEFNGSVFYGDVTLEPQVSVKVPKHNAVVVISGDFTNGSDTITNISPMTIDSEYVGAMIWKSGYIPVDTRHYILEVGSNYVVMDCDAIDTGSAKTFNVANTITIGFDDDTRITLALREAESRECVSNIIREVYQQTVGSDNVRDLIAIRVFDGIEPCTTGYDTGATNIDKQKTDVVFIRREPGSTAPLIWATQGSRYNPTLNGPELVGDALVYNESEGYQGNTDVLHNYVYWSKFKEPEHVPLNQNTPLGGSDKIDRMVPLRDVLLIFKKDGLFGIIGYNAESGFTTQILNNDVRLLRPDASVVVDDLVYAITRNGFVTIDSTGNVTPLSRYLFHSDIKDKLDELYNDGDTETLGCWVTYDAKNQEVYFSLVESGVSTAQTIYVYNIITQTFTTWYMDGTDPIGIAHINRCIVSDESILLVSGPYHDQSSNAVWEIDETEYGRDKVFADLASFFIGDQDGTPTAVLESASEDIDVGNYLEYDGDTHEITAVDTSTGSGNIILPMEGVAANTPYLVLVDADYIWLFTKVGPLYFVSKIDKTDLTITKTASAITGTPYGVCSDGTNLYWTDSTGKIYKWNGTDASATNLFTATGPVGIAWYSGNLYYAKYSVGTITYRPDDGTGVETDLETGLTSPYAVFIYGTDIYWSESTKISYRAIAAGSPAPIIIGLSGILSICVDGTNLYWITATTINYNNLIAGGPHELTTGTALKYINVYGETFYWTDTIEETVSMADFFNSFHKLTLADVTGIDNYFPDVDIYDPISIVCTWLPKFGQTRALRKHFLAGAFIFSETDGLDYYQRRLSDSDSYVEAEVKDSTCRYMVPIANARKLQIEPSIKIESIENANWELTGMSLEYTAQAPRGVKT